MLIPSAYAAELSFYTSPNNIKYGVSLPGNYSAQTEYDAVLSLPPGGQDKSMAILGVKNWLDYFSDKQLIVITPIAPKGKMFFRGAEQVLPEFMQHITEKYAIKNKRFYLLGVSNGGISAFRAATLYPEWFNSLTVVPGYPSQPDNKRLEKLKDIPVTLIVGEYDGGWLSNSQKAHQQLNALGSNSKLITIAKEDHFMHARLSAETIYPYLIRR